MTPPSMRNPGLCEVCLACLVDQDGLQVIEDREGADETEDGTRYYLAHKTAASLEKSSEEGCTFCRLLWQRLSHTQQAAVREFEVKKDSALTAIVVFPPTLLKPLNAWCISPNIIPDDPVLLPGQPRLEAIIFVAKPVQAEENAHTSYPAGDSTESPEAWRIVTKWLADCCINHSECSGPKSDAWYPTRLLDVGTEPTDEIRLILNTSIIQADDYITLSHCWGKTPTYKLTKSTYEHLLTGINVTQLPLTFPHAITITRRLSKRLFWIDSLCIFQDDDDKSDWLREAQLMDRVFSHAFLNISATGAKDGSQGLFAYRNPQFELAPTTFLWRPPPLAGSETGPVEAYILTEYMFLNRELMHAPIHQRGWVLQERLLAKRVLHFGTSQLFWECKHGVLCERFPEYLPAFMRDMGPATFKSLTRAYNDEIKPTPVDGRTEVKMYKLCDKVRGAYSRSLLTYPEDKLIALSGIAKVVREIFGDEYVAGMWRSCLESQLLWAIDETVQIDGSASTRDFAYRAPTWSWMSVEGVVTGGGTSLSNLLFEVINIHLQHSTEDDTSILKYGRLTLRGRLRQVQLRPLMVGLDESDPEFEDLNRKAEEKGLSLKDFERPMVGQWVMTVGGKDLQSSKGQIWQRLGPLVKLDVQQADFAESNRKGELYMMSAQGPGGMDDKSFSEGISPWLEIILLRCVDSEKGVYHRFGVASMKTTGEKQEMYKSIQEYDDDEADVPAVAYDASSHLHTIIVE